MYEAGNEVLPAHGIQLCARLLGMQRGVMIHARGISFAQRAGIRRKLGIAGLDDFPNAKKLHHVIIRRGVFAIHTREFAARGEQHALHGFEIIFGMRIRKTVRHISIRLAENMRHAPFVAENTDVIARCVARSVILHGPSREEPNAEDYDRANSGEEQERSFELL